MKETLFICYMPRKSKELKRWESVTHENQSKANSGYQTKSKRCGNLKSFNPIDIMCEISHGTWESNRLQGKKL
jgi:hypothetical protein